MLFEVIRTYLMFIHIRCHIYMKIYVEHMVEGCTTAMKVMLELELESLLNI